MISLESVAHYSILKKAWKGVKLGKNEDVRDRSRGFDLVSIADYGRDLDSNLRALSEKLTSQSYTPSPLQGFFVEKSTKGKYRLVLAPTIEDRIVQRALLSKITNATIEHVRTGVSFGGVPRRSKKERKFNHLTAIEKLASHFKDNLYEVFESDIKSFYDSIPKQRLFDHLNSVIEFDSYTEKTIYDYIFYHVGNEEELRRDSRFEEYMISATRGISQGSGLSPYFANLYLEDFDIAVRDEYEGRMVRYIDDFIIIKKPGEDPTQFVIDILKEKDLEIKLEKTKSLNMLDTKDSFSVLDGKKLRDHSLEFIGLSISKYHIQQKLDPFDQVREFTDQFLGMTNAKKLSKYKRLTDSEIMKNYNQIISGFVNFYANYHTDKLMEILDNRLTTKRLKGLTNSKQVLKKRKTKYPLFTETEWQDLFRAP